MPLEYRVNGINGKLASWIDTDLHGEKNGIQQGGNTFPLDILQSELGTGSGTASTGRHPVPQTEFESATVRMAKRIRRQTALKRLIRNHAAIIIAGIAAAGILTAGGISYHTAQGERPVSTGLTSAETLTTFYAGMDTQDTELMQDMARGHGANIYINSVSGIFVAGKVRQAYENIAGPVTPELWLLNGGSAKQPVYGLTDFTLDSRESRPVSSARLRKAAPRPLAVENGTRISDGATATHTAGYYVVYSQGDSLAVVQYRDTATLTYIKNRWIITDIHGESTEIPVDMQTFRKDIETAGAASGGDTVKTLRRLRSRYPWLPTEAAMLQAAESQPEKK